VFQLGSSHSTLGKRSHRVLYYTMQLHVCVSQNLLRWFSNKIPMSDDKGRVHKIVQITFQFDHNYRGICMVFVLPPSLQSITW